MLNRIFGNSILAIVLSTSLPISAETLKDPMTRDEDISGTKINASYRQLPDGIYEYIYDIESPTTNKGKISSFSLDISCDDDFPPVTYSEEPGVGFRNHSLDGKHIPVQVYGVMYHTVKISIGEANNLSWMIAFIPGEVGKGYRVLSSVGPGQIAYKLSPVMDAEGWDYRSYLEQGIDTPWIDDFTVTGTILGPACPSKTQTYAGTSLRRQELPETNVLLTYTTPRFDRFHVGKDIKEVDLTIHYSENIDPKTFKVEPGYIKHLFNPVPGTSETVRLPLKKNGNSTKKAKFKLEVRMNEKAKGYNKTKAEQMKDTDVFEIRIDD